MSEKSRTALKAAIVATLMAGFIATAAEAKPDGVVTIADTLHPNIHTTLTNNSKSNASPNGNANGNNLHGIANNPGQSGADPSDGRPGFADQLDTGGGLHGGIDLVNKVAAGTQGGPLP